MNVHAAVIVALLQLVILPVAVLSVELDQTDFLGKNSSIDDLARRVIGDRASEFTFLINTSLNVGQSLSGGKQHKVNIENEPSGGIRITANSGVAAAWAFNYYIRRFGKCQISWDERQTSALPDPLPAVPQSGIQLQSKYEQIYMGNPCVYSYSMPFWKWTQWEQFVDWLALNGINLFLMPIGYETVLYDMYRTLGLSDAEASSFLVGPAFQGWFEMGNIRNFSGPLTQAWLRERQALGIQIMKRMSELGMRVVLPAFNGLVPPQIARLYPSVQLQQLPWLQFPQPQNQYFLSIGNSSVYISLMRAYFKQAEVTFGTSLFSGINAFLIDSFNEMNIPIGSEQFLADYAKLVSNTLTALRSDYQWVLQGWMLRDWNEHQARALFSNIPIGRLLVLDLYAETAPVYSRFNNFEGHLFIWCMLHDFGGANGMFGNFASVTPGPQLLIGNKNVSLAGIGLTMEGFYQNYALYQLMLDNAYPDSPMTAVSDWSDWLNAFAEQRYGISMDSQYTDLILGWYIAANTIYTTDGGGGVTAQSNEPYIRYMRSRPTSLISTSQSQTKGALRYEPDRVAAQSAPVSSSLPEDYQNQLFTAWRLFLNVPEWLKNVSSYQHDLVDLSRQALSALHKQRFEALLREFNDFSKPSRYARVANAGNQLLETLNAIDDILGTHRAFMLGPWLDLAAAWNGTFNTSGVANLLYFNAKSQLTTWGDAPCCQLVDYAGKQWNGLMRAYYIPRLTLFLERLLGCVFQGRAWTQADTDSYNSAVFALVEVPFGRSTAKFPSNPLGDPHSTSRLLYERFAGR